MSSLWIAVGVWGLSFALAKKSLAVLSPFELVFIRLALGTLTAFVVSRALRPRERTAAPAGAFKAASKAAIALGLLEFAGTYIFYTWSLLFLPSGVVAMLTLLTPVLTFLISCAAGAERWRLAGVMASVLSFLGASLCLPGNSASMMAGFLTGSALSAAAVDTLKGVALIMTSNILFAAGNVLITKWQGGGLWSPDLTYKGLFVGAVAAFIVLMFTGHSDWNELARLDIWILPLYLGVVATGLGFYLWNRGVGATSAFKASVVGNFKGPAAVAFAAFLLNEQITAKFAAGVAMMLGALYVLANNQWRLKKAAVSANPSFKE